MRTVFVKVILLVVVSNQIQSLNVNKRSDDDHFIEWNENVPDEVVRSKVEYIDKDMEWNVSLKDETSEDYKTMQQIVERKLSEMKELRGAIASSPSFEKTEDNKVKITVIVHVVADLVESHGFTRYKRNIPDDVLSRISELFGSPVTVSSPGEIDDTCGEGNECKIDHTECVHEGGQGYCQCEDGYVNEDGVRNKCHPERELGEPCEIQNQCHGASQICASSSKKCECEAGAYAKDDSCFKLHKKLHKKCTETAQCLMRNSECASSKGTCECEAGFEEPNDKPNTCYDPNNPDPRTDCESKPNWRCVPAGNCKEEYEMDADCAMRGDICCHECESLKSDELASSCVPKHECPYPYRKKAHCDHEGENCCRTCENSVNADCVPSDGCPDHLQEDMFCNFKSDVCCKTCARLGGQCVPSSRCELEEQEDAHCPNKDHVCCIEQ